MEVTTQPPDAAGRLTPGSDWDPARPTPAGFVAVAGAAAAAGARTVTIAAHPATPESDAAAEGAGFVATRDMLQLRRRLPVDAEAPVVSVRPFRPGTDDQQWLEVNRRAFTWHPEQGSWTSGDLARHMAEPWFDPNGFLIHDADAMGTIDAFCWTKVHPATGHDPAMGEIFVIAVDPDAHGQGLGRAMVVAGLNHLHARGMTESMLYVERDNTAGLALYASLGFHEHERHRWYSFTVTP
jgi:mycothiol synthase